MVSAYRKLKDNQSNQRTNQSGRSREESFMKKHEEEVHGGQVASFKARVTHTNKDCLTRQVREGVLIRRCRGPIMNSKTEWFQPPLFKIQNEVVRE